MRHIIYLLIILALCGCTTGKDAVVFNEGIPTQFSLKFTGNFHNFDKLELLPNKPNSTPLVGEILIREDGCYIFPLVRINTRNQEGFIKYWEYKPDFNTDQPVILELTYWGKNEDHYLYTLAINGQEQPFTSPEKITDIRPMGEGIEIAVMQTPNATP